MRRTKSVIDVNIRQGGQGLGKLGVVLLLSGVEAQVLQEKHLTRLKLLSQLLNNGANEISDVDEGFPQKGFQADGNRLQTHLLHHFAVGPAQV